MVEPVFLALLRRENLPKPECEYRAVPGRLFRCDYAWPAARLALEVQGGIFVQGRHSRGVGMLRDFEKFNALAVGGWRVLLVTPKQLLTADTVRLIRAALAAPTGGVL